MTVMKAKERAVHDRIKHLEEAIAKGREYIEFDKHSEWHGFRPLFSSKKKDDEIVPPHKDWVKNVFLPSKERALRISLKALETIANKESGK